MVLLPDCACCGCEITNPRSVYFNRRSFNGLSLNFDNYPNCGEFDLGAEKITGTFSVSRSFRFWRNVYSTCQASQPTTITSMSVVFKCLTGSITVNGEVLNAGQEKTDPYIYFLSYVYGDQSSFNGGERYNVSVESSNTSYSVEATLDWDTQRDHDLYGIVECYNPAP